MKYLDSVVVVFSLRISAIRDFFYFFYKLRQYPVLPISFVSSERICAVMQRKMPKSRSVLLSVVYSTVSVEYKNSVGHVYHRTDCLHCKKNPGFHSMQL